MRGGSNQWTCARKSSKDNKLYETVSPGENIQRLLSDNRLTTSRPLSSDSITERTNRAAEAAKRAKLVPSQVLTSRPLSSESSSGIITSDSVAERTKRAASAAKRAKLVPSQARTKKSTTNSSIKQRTKRTASAAKHAKLVPSQVLTS
tara:strand:- start:9482 stop:9925 length:444 start_codon:yes stop_codon:yes gene_type:complete